MYLYPQKRKRSSSWRVLILLVLIAGGIYVYTLVRREKISSPFVPTPTPTRSAFSYTTEAQGLYMQGGLEGAITAYEAAVELEPDDATLYAPLVRLLAFEGRSGEAIERGREAIALNPDSAANWAALGMAYDWDGQVPQAIDACLRAVELDSTYPEAHAYLAEAYADAKRWDEALEEAQVALALDSRNVDANRNYAYVLYTMGDWNSAVEAYRQALDVHPNLAHIYMELGWNYQALADTANAIEAFRRAAELDPDRAEALDQLGWTYANIQEYERAQTYLEQAIEVDPEYAPAYGHLAYTFWTRRNYEDALPNYEKAIELAYRAARRDAESFYVTVEPAEDDDPYPSPDVVLEGQLEWDDEEVCLEAALEPADPSGGWVSAGGRLVLDTVTGRYTLELEAVPAPSGDQFYAGWFEGLDALDGLPLGAGPLHLEANGNLQVQLLAEPILGPRIEYFYTLGLCYFYMAQCERAYPLFDAALQMDPQEYNALEGVRLCQEAEGTPSAAP